MRALSARAGMEETVGDQCQYGLRAPLPGGGWAPAVKPTRFLSSAPEVVRRLGKRCRHRHPHQRLEGGRAHAAAIYPPALCRAILCGIEAQRRREGLSMPEHIKKELDRGCALYALHQNDAEEEPITPMDNQEFAHVKDEDCPD